MGKDVTITLDLPGSVIASAQRLLDEEMNEKGREA